MHTTYEIGDIVRFHIHTAGFPREVVGKITAGPRSHNGKNYWTVETSKPSRKSYSLLESQILGVIKKKTGNLSEPLSAAIKKQRNENICAEIGSKFTIKNLSNSEEKSYTIVDPNLTSPSGGLLGLNTPLAQIILGNFVGHVFTLPSGEWVILDIEHQKVEANSKPLITEEKIENVFDLEFEEKNIIIKAHPNKRQLIQAGPGTGKSFCLTHRAACLIEKYRLSPSEILIISFSREAVAEVKRRLSKFRDERIQWINPITIDSLASWILISTTNDKQWLNRSFDSNVTEAKKFLTEFGIQKFRHVLIDEVQDIVGVRADFVLEVLGKINEDCGYSIFGDFNQSIYDWTLKDSDLSNINSNHFNEVISDLKGVEKLSLTKQHRMASGITAKLEIEKLIRSLEKGTVDLNQCLDIFKRVITEVSKCASHGQEKFGQNSLLSAEPNKKKALLVRTNGQILGEIADNLNCLSNVRLLGKYSKGLLPGWVAKLLYDLRLDSRNILDRKQTFKSAFAKIAEKDGWEEDEAFYLLKHIERQPNPNYVHLEKLKGNLKSIKDVPLSTKEQALITISPLTISTIHCSKGLEFDDVVMSEPELDKITSKDDLLAELKLFYVGLTRAKNSIHLISPKGLSQLYGFNTNPNSTSADRWIRREGRDIRMNIDADDDVDGSSFITDFGYGTPEEIQDYIQLAVRPNDRVEIFFDKSPSGDSRYYIKHQGKVIGCMSFNFFSSMSALSRQFGPRAKRFESSIGKVYSEFRFDPFSSTIKNTEFTNSIEVWLAVKLTGTVLI